MIGELNRTAPGESQAAEMAAAWRRGERPPAEFYLAHHPELIDPAEGAVRLIYEEVCLRQERGEVVSVEELAQRFPAWADELAVMIDCHRLIQSRLAPPPFPSAGDALGDFQLVKELGRGTHGRVFLATQPTLADRAVVLKVTPRQDREFPSLARLQHTHIIPLLAAYDYPASNVRALCQPYLGGATLSRLFEDLWRVPNERRTGQMLVEILDSAGKCSPAAPARRGPREALATTPYPEAICWVGACLAEALQHAHERDLVHLDIKPSNILLAADGQPLLLDFHLSIRPVKAGDAAPEGLGGTPEYMSPEQRAAFAAARRGLAVPVAVDGRSDVYSLGRVLYVALGGDLRGEAPLYRLNRQVSVGLSDIIQRCLAADAGRRYPNAGALAADLRRHLANLPLGGVRNRNLPERWRKWRRRRPQAMLWLSLILALTAGLILLVATTTQGPAVPEKPAARPADFWEKFEAGVLAYQAGRPDDAARAFGEAASLAPDAAEVYFNRALALTASGRPEDACHDYDQALLLKPSLAAASLNRGLLHHAAGRHAEAIADLERALKDGADPAVAHYNLALVRLGRGENFQARAEVERALTHAPNHEGAKALRARLSPAAPAAAASTAPR